jgi:hypothetical protein
MKRQWRIARTTTAQVNAQQRWDQAYHHLLRWAVASEPNPATDQPPVLPVMQEESHASSSICTGVNIPPSPSTND